MSHMIERGDRALLIALLCLVLTQVAHFYLVRWFAGVFFAIYVVFAFLWYWGARREP